MMNENSPICARLMPASIDVRMPLPVKNAPSATLTTLPATTSTARTTIGTHSRATAAGSISMPTATKKIAAKRSRTGSIRCSIASPCPDSAASEPARNAPSATE